MTVWSFFLVRKKVLRFSFHQVISLISIVWAPKTWFPSLKGKKFLFRRCLLGRWSLVLKTSFRAQKRCRYRFRRLFNAQIASRTLRTRFWSLQDRFFLVRKKVLVFSFQQVILLISMVGTSKTWFLSWEGQKFWFRRYLLGR